MGEGEFTLSLDYVCFRDPTQVIRLGGKCLYQLSHLTGLNRKF